jgi:hypothetical protein
MFAFSNSFILLVILADLVKWLVIGGGAAGIIWLIYRAGQKGMFD